MIRHPEGKLAGQTSDFFASTHDVPRTLLSFMGVRAPGLMDGEDLSVLFDGGRPPERHWFTSCYDNYVLAGDRDWFMIADSEGRHKRLYDKRADPRELHDVAREHPEIVDRLWQVLSRRGRRHPPAVRSLGGEGGDRRVEAHPPRPAAPGRRRGGGRHGARGAAAGGSRRNGLDRDGRRRALLVVLPLVRADPRERLPGRLRHRHAEPRRPARAARCASTARYPSACRRCLSARTLADRHALIPVPRLAAHGRDAGSAWLQPGVETGSR